MSLMDNTEIDYHVLVEVGAVDKSSTTIFSQEITIESRQFGYAWHDIAARYYYIIMLFHSFRTGSF